jgi:hypothetical protein
VFRKLLFPIFVMDMCPYDHSRIVIDRKVDFSYLDFVKKNLA